MSQQQIPAVPQQQAKTSTTPTAPLPIDLTLLSKICGGTATSTPTPTW
ncbi:hypothetical protein [Piscinibacter sp. XHJ-5]|nr:hypothetical protein [Piscinibacter sp. XHJ-5]